MGYTGPAPVISKSADADFKEGLRAYNHYRDLGILAATNGKFVAHVIRATEALESSAGLHDHELDFQIVFVLKGSMTVRFPGFGTHKLVEGDSLYQPPGIPHEVIAASADMEVLEICSPGDFGTRELG